MGNVLVNWEFGELKSNKVREEKMKVSRYGCSGLSWSGLATDPTRDFSLNEKVFKGSKFGLTVIRKVKSIVPTTKKFKVFFSKKVLEAVKNI